MSERYANDMDTTNTNTNNINNIFLIAPPFSKTQPNIKIVWQYTRSIVKVNDEIKLLMMRATGVRVAVAA